MIETELLARVTFDPAQCGGGACLRGMRIRVSDVLDMLAGGATREEILRDIPYLEDQDISAALLYAARAAETALSRAERLVEVR